MDLQSKTVYLLHDEDSYEIVVNAEGNILEIWRYANNNTCKPTFVRYEWLDEILQDRIHDRIVRNL